VAIAVIVAVGKIGVGRLQAVSRANEEARLEEPEITECKQRLAMFYNAWKTYKTDHNGTEPQSLDVLIPKYIKSPELLICPTAVRLGKKKIHIDQGALKYKGQVYPDTYGFKWLAGGFPIFLKRKGDEIPLIICTAHREATYMAAYGKLVQDKDFDAAHRDSLISSVRDAPFLAARRNGKIEAIDTTKD